MYSEKGSAIALAHDEVERAEDRERTDAEHEAGGDECFADVAVRGLHTRRDPVADSLEALFDTLARRVVGKRVLFFYEDADAIRKDDVVFVVDIMSVQPTEVLEGPEGETASDLPADLPTVEEKDGQVTGISFDKAPKQPPKDLEIVTLIEGEGPPARDDSLVTFDYLGQIYGSNTIFDESYSSAARTPSSRRSARRRPRL